LIAADREAMTRLSGAIAEAKAAILEQEPALAMPGSQTPWLKHAFIAYCGNVSAVTTPTL